MVSLNQCLIAAAIGLLAAVCVVDSLPARNGFMDGSWGPARGFTLREAENIRGAPRKPDNDDAASFYRRERARGKGLGSLLLKNLRFRDLSDQLENSVDDSYVNQGLPRQLVSNSMFIPHHLPEIQGHPLGASLNHDMAKRQSVSVSQLAQLLHSLKTRNAGEDGVKLQSLRFGRK